MNEFYFGTDNWMRRLIRRTWERLPDDVAAFARDRCRYLSISSGNFGQSVPASIAIDSNTGTTDNVWLILLDQAIVGDTPDGDEDGLGIVAHEIAHAFLGHNWLAAGLTPGEEAAARQQAKDWGFMGRGTEPLPPETAPDADPISTTDD